MKTETPRISVGYGNDHDSRYPLCDELQPQWEKEGKGWIVEIEMAKPDEFANLMDKAAYDKLCAEAEH